jgi:hypothetical protein
MNNVSKLFSRRSILMSKMSTKVFVESGGEFRAMTTITSTVDI